MPTAEHVRELTFETFDTARERAGDLVVTGSKAAGRVAGEVRERAADVELPAVDELVDHASSHKVRTTLVASLVLLVVFIVVRKLLSGSEEPRPDVAS
jgi:hypothetical protein